MDGVVGEGLPLHMRIGGTLVLDEMRESPTSSWGLELRLHLLRPLAWPES